MKASELWNALVKRWWLILALVLIAALIAAVVAQVQNPVYKVETIMAATAPENPSTKLPDATVEGVYIAGGTVSIANATESLDVAEAVSLRLQESGIDIPPEELLGKVSAIPEAQSTSIRLTFSDGSPTRVAEIANAWGETLQLMTTGNLEDNPYYDETLKDALLGGTLVFTNRAIVPEKPTQPKPYLYVGLGIFIGLILGVALAIAIEYFNPHFRSPREVEDNLGMPVLGTLPKERGARSTALLPAFGEGSYTWLSYSELRAGIILSQDEESSRSILMVSAMPFDGAPSIAANLAISIANAGRKTLLVDCDMGERAVSQLLEAEGKPGLSDALERSGDVWDEITDTKFENLSLLPAGKTSKISAELLSMPIFEEILRDLETHYKKVLIYAPPLAISIDGPVIASKANVTLYIIDADKTTRTAAADALNGLERVNVKPAGIVLANVKVKGKERARLSTKAAPEKKKEKGKPAAGAVPAAKTAAVTVGGAAAAETVKEKKRKRPEKKRKGREKAKGKAAVPPAKPKPYLTPGKTAAVKEPPEKAAEKPVEKKPEPAVPGKPEEELKQIKEIVSDDFSRMGETGAPIPREWLRALNSDKADVRESATDAITAYYHAFLRRYNISDESIGLITEAIIRMMRREGEFAHMKEKEAQQYLQEMLVDAGAKFSGSPSSGPPGTSEQGTGSGITSIAPKAGDELGREQPGQLERETKEDAKAEEDQGGIDWE